MERFLITMIGAMALTCGLSLSPAAYGQASDAAPTITLTVAKQNALVQEYCAVCHSDAKPTGGLSLEKFDAAHPDPGIAAMMVSKMKEGAMSAAQIAQPDRVTVNALIKELSAKAVGANTWTVTQAPILTASIVMQAPVTANTPKPNLYRLAITCRADTREGQMQLAWAPDDLTQSGSAMSAAVDGSAPATYSIKEGDGAVVLYAAKQNPGAPGLAAPLPGNTLRISNLFPGEMVTFPFDNLTPAVRQSLSQCFTGGASK